MLRDELPEDTLLTGRRAINSHHGSAINITSTCVNPLRLGKGRRSSLNGY